MKGPGDLKCGCWHQNDPDQPIEPETVICSYCDEIIVFELITQLFDQFGTLKGWQCEECKEKGVDYYLENNYEKQTRSRGRNARRNFSTKLL